MKDLGGEGEHPPIWWPDSFDFAQDRLFGYASELALSASEGMTKPVPRTNFSESV